MRPRVLGLTSKLALCAFVALGFPLSVGAEPGEEAAKPAARTPSAPVGLDALFKLPSQAPRIGATEKGGATRRQWLERFDLARDDLTRAKARLTATQEELERLASSSQSWQVAAPGGQPGAENGPLSFRLRQQIRGDREAVEVAEHGLTELRVEATLAGVPWDWTGEAGVPPVEPLRPTFEDATPTPSRSSR